MSDEYQAIRNQRWIAGISIAIALAFGVGLCAGTIVKVDRAVLSASAQHEERLEELRAALGCAILSQDIEIAGLKKLYGGLRSDLYTEWTKGIKPIRPGVGKGGVD